MNKPPKEQQPSEFLLKALPVHQAVAKDLYQQYGPEAAINYLLVVGNVPPS